ncbi:hypothetical protein S245_065270, partial [Arachis hypogaea]
PYVGIITPAELHGHLDVCDTVGPLVLFESNGFLRTEWFASTDMHSPPSGNISHTSSHHRHLGNTISSIDSLTVV